MGRPVLLGLVRLVLLALLPALALPLGAWAQGPTTSGPSATAGLSVLSAPADATRVAVPGVQASAAGQAAGDGHVVTTQTSARQAPTERVTADGPPPPEDPPAWRVVAAPPPPGASRPCAVGPDAAGPRTSDHEPTLGRAPPSVTCT